MHVRFWRVVTLKKTFFVQCQSLGLVYCRDSVTVLPELKKSLILEIIFPNIVKKKKKVIFSGEFAEIYLTLNRADLEWLKFSIFIIGARIIESIWEPEKHTLPLLLPKTLE